MIRFNPALGLSAALLLAIPLAGAEYRDPSGYEPPPFFEDEGLVGNIGAYRKPPAAAPRSQPARVETAPVQPPEPTRAELGPAAAPVAKPVLASPGRDGEAPAAASAEIPAALPGLLVDNAPVGLILLALAGWVFGNAGRPGAGRRGAQTAENQAAPALATAAKPGAPRNPATADTGVARYLRSRGIG